MKWSWKIGRYAGVDVYMHATFLLLIAFVALSHWIQGGDASAVVSGVVFIMALFGCVLLHEFGHALAARRFAIQTRDITLLPIGGVARLERMPDKPAQELWVALAGPAVNVAIAAGLWVWIALTSGFEPVQSLGVARGSLLERLLVVNLFLVIFNMIPAFPMDGGRVLRAILAMRLEYTRATQIAAGLGQGLAFVFGLIGLFTNPFLLFIALFVWIGAAQESAMVQMKASLGGIPVARAMMTDFRMLEPSDPLGRAVELVLSGSQVDFPVAEGCRIVGMLTRARLIEALTSHGTEARVGDAMQRQFFTAEGREMLEPALARLQECECHTLPVVEDGRIVGLLTMDNVGEFVLLQAALRGRIGAGRSPGLAVPSAATIRS
jgi:Zn-dependent protease